MLFGKMIFGILGIYQENGGNLKNQDDNNILNDNDDQEDDKDQENGFQYEIPNITFLTNIRLTTIIPKVHYPDKSLSRKVIILTSHYPDNFRKNYNGRDFQIARINDRMNQKSDVYTVRYNRCLPLLVDCPVITMFNRDRMIAYFFLGITKSHIR